VYDNKRKVIEYFTDSNEISYCNEFAQSIARQRLGKHVPTLDNGNCVSVDGCYSSLLGSSQRAHGLTR
jgi:hypothetical protein